VYDEVGMERKNVQRYNDLSVGLNKDIVVAWISRMADHAYGGMNA